VVAPQRKLGRSSLMDLAPALADDDIELKSHGGYNILRHPVRRWISSMNRRPLLEIRQDGGKSPARSSTGRLWT